MWSARSAVVVCDDLELEVEGDRVVRVQNGCIKETADILKEADRPLLYGWSSTHGEAQSVGVHIAELIGAVIDNTSTVCHGPSILAIQEVGHPGSLGQVKNRADVIIYWGCNPIEAHPRHMSRYTTYATGFFVNGMHNGNAPLL